MKQPNWKVPLVLSASLLAIGSFSYWLAYSHKPKTERADTLIKKPLGIADENAQITQLRIKTDKGLIEAKCNSVAQKTCKVGASGDWSITYPIEVKADADSIKDLLTQMTNMTAAETIDLSEETQVKQQALLIEYGLSDKRRTDAQTEFVELTLEDGKKKTAWFGESHPVGDKTFVGSSENGVLNQKTIFLIANFYKANFEKSLTHFRDKSIFHFSRSDVDSFTASTSSGKLTGKLENGLWTLNGFPGDRDRIQTVFSAISQAKAKEFVDEKDLKGSKKIISYSLHDAKGTAPTFDLYESIKGRAPVDDIRYFVKPASAKEIYEVEALFKGQLDKKIGQLRESALLKQTEKLTATQMSLSGKTYSPEAQFHFDGKSWKQMDAGPKMDAGQISSFLDLLIQSHAQEIVSQTASSGDESFTFTLGDDAHPKKSNYFFFSVKEKLFAKDLNAKNNEVYLLDSGLKTALPFKPESWKIK